MSCHDTPEPKRACCYAWCHTGRFSAYRMDQQLLVYISDSWFWVGTSPQELVWTIICVLKLFLNDWDYIENVCKRNKWNLLENLRNRKTHSFQLINSRYIWEYSLSIGLCVLVTSIIQNSPDNCVMSGSN